MSSLPTNKSVNTKPLGLLQPIPLLTQILDELTTYFITHLSSSFGHTVIWVVCDRLSKFSHFIALPTSFTASQLTNRFSVEICRLHNVPKSFISDKNPLFLNNFWKQLFHLQGTKLNFSIAYHPQTNGQTELLNRGLEIYLCCFVSDHPRT